MNKKIPYHERWLFVLATFLPLKTDDLRPEMKEFIGQTLTWEYQWVQEENERYPGQRVYRYPENLRKPGKNCPAYWIPECDLDFIAMIF
jgi:hypothetical protein